MLQRIWNETAFQTDELITEDGGKLEILNPGVRNLAKEGQILKGGFKNFEDGWWEMLKLL